MKDLSLGMLIAVFEEMFGKGLFWLLVTIAVLITLAFLYVLLRERRLEESRLVRAHFWGPIGAVLAIAIVLFVTSSGLSSMGGPIDIITLALIGIYGGIGLIMWAYVLQFFFGKKKQTLEQTEQT